MTMAGQHVCYTLEPAYERIPHPAIPQGTYLLTLQTFGTVYGWMCTALKNHTVTPNQQGVAASFRGEGIPLLQNVPGRSGVELHIGNTAADSEGCSLIGAGQGNGRITGSTEAYYSFYPVISDYIKSDPANAFIDYIDQF